MRVLILANKITWIGDLKKKTENVESFFSPLGFFGFTIEKTNFKKIPLETFIDSNGNEYQGINETWYDNNISLPAKARDFDMVALLIKPEDWTGGDVQGYGTTTDCGIEEMVILANRTGKYTFNTIQYKGDQLTHILQHEILHRLYDFYKLQDNTHKWYFLEKPEKCLEEIKAAQVPKLFALLIRKPSGQKETLGDLMAIKDGNVFTCKTLELPDLNNIVDKSCIPKGNYSVIWSYSPKFKKYTYEVANVVNRPGIRIHAGNYYQDTQGCILLGDGYNDINADTVPDVINSKATVEKLEGFFNRQGFNLIII